MKKILPKPSRRRWVTQRVSPKIQPGRFLDIAGYRARSRRRFVIRLHHHLLGNIPGGGGRRCRRHRCCVSRRPRWFKPLHSCVLLLLTHHRGGPELQKRRRRTRVQKFFSPLFARRGVLQNFQGIKRRGRSFLSLREQKGIRATVPPSPPRRETTVHLFEVPIVLELVVVVERLVFRSRAFVGDENARRFFHPSSRDGIIHFLFLVFQSEERSSPFLNFFRQIFHFFRLSRAFITFCVCCASAKIVVFLVVLITSPPRLFYNTRQRRVHNKQTTKTHV